MKALVSTGRRGFLLAAGFGSAGAIAVVATRNATPSTPHEQACAAGTTQGYRLTEHIEKYYKTTET
jgi:hypothetical protein